MTDRKIKPVRTGWCNQDIPLGHPSHARCTPDLQRRETPDALLVCPCDCHAAPVAAVVEPPAPDPGDEHLVITEPTVLYDLDEESYHSHPTSLSASGAKLLAPPTSCPQKFQWRREHPVFKDDYDFGHVAHRYVLGKGSDVVVVDEASWRTKAAQEAKAAARFNGKAPILAKDNEKAVQLADAVRVHPIAGPLFAEGQAEVSLFWPDDHGVTRRARLDWLCPKVDGRRRIVVDLKTARDSEPFAFSRSAADYGYHISAGNYVDGVIACGLDDDPIYLLVVVEKTEPFVITVVQVNDDDIRLGRSLMTEAARIYAACTANDHWPGYASDITPLELPGYYLNRIEDYVS